MLWDKWLPEFSGNKRKRYCQVRFTRGDDEFMTTSPVRAPRCKEISCKGWPQQAVLRCLMNNLDPDVAERPDELLVYGGGGGAAPKNGLCRSIRVWVMRSRV